MISLLIIIFRKFTLLQIFHILKYTDQLTFNKKLLKYCGYGVSYSFLISIKLVFDYLMYSSKSTHHIILPLSKENIKKNNHSLLTFNKKNFSKLPIIQMNIIIHSIKSKSSLTRSIKSITKSEFSNVKIRKYFLNTFKYDFQDIKVIQPRDFKDNSDELVFFLTSGDTLEDSFFFEIYKFISRNLNAKVIYFNERKSLLSNKFKHIAKPYFSPDYLENHNYIGSNFIVAKNFEKDFCALKKDNNFHKFLLNISLKVDGNSIYLLNKLFIKSYFLQSNLSEGHRKNTSDAISSYHKKIGINAKIRFFKDQPLIIYKSFNPIVSIIIPASGNFYKGNDLLLVLLDSIFSNTEYNNYEILIIDHDNLNFEHLKVINSRSNVKRVKLKKLSSVNDFNFSRNCNIAAKHARGDYLLFLNDDMKVINSSWLSYLAGHFIKPHTGIVGGKLLFSNNRIQHGGVGLLKGDPGHLYENKPYDFHEANKTKNLLAVTGACLMIKKEFFYDVGCFDETIFKTNYSDTDLCLKVISRLKKYVIYEPKCQLYHFASISRVDAYSNVSPDTLNNFRDKWGFLFHDKFINSNYVHELQSLKINV